jgi:hypothetical protein
MVGVVRCCRACAGKLGVIMADLGMQPPSNAYVSAEALTEEKRYPLRAKVCEECMLVQVDYDVDPKELFADYAYFSSYSDQWLEHARQYCRMAMQRFALGPQSLVIELASNDGYLLKNFRELGVPVLGIDPSVTVAAAAEKLGVPTLVEFFGETLAQTLAAQGRLADLVIGNNVLAQVPDLNDFVAGIALLLKPCGTVTIEFPHLLRLIEHVEFDTIYHEHYSYISLHAIERVFNRHGLKLHDVEELPTHGGSLRIFASREARPGMQPSPALAELRAREVAAGLTAGETYTRFAARVEECRRSVLAFFDQVKQQRKSVSAYGAAAKGNTLLNYCGLGRGDIALVADRNPHKQSKLLPGSHIPVVSPERLMQEKPDYVLILPWNLQQEIRTQMSGIAAWGGQFVTAIPLLRIYP